MPARTSMPPFCKRHSMLDGSRRSAASKHSRAPASSPANSSALPMRARGPASLGSAAAAPSNAAAASVYLCMLNSAAPFDRQA